MEMLEVQERHDSSRGVGETMHQASEVYLCYRRPPLWPQRFFNVCLDHKRTAPTGEGLQSVPENSRSRHGCQESLSYSTGHVRCRGHKKYAQLSTDRKAPPGLVCLIEALFPYSALAVSVEKIPYQNGEYFVRPSKNRLPCLAQYFIPTRKTSAFSTSPLYMREKFVNSIYS